jgi:PAS domain S-box-containing protein
VKQTIKAYRQLCRARQAAGLLVALPGALVLLGWLFDVAALRSLLPRLETMKANTALCFLLAGLALWPKPGAEDWRRLAAQACAVLIWLIGLLTLGEYVTGLNFGLDELLFRDEPLSPVTAYPGRMGLNTALGFILSGAALMWAQSDGWRARWSQGCALLVGLLGFITLIGYGYSLIQLTRFSSSNSMALHTALGFLVLAFGLLCLRPEAGVMGLALSDGLAGMVLRRLLPLIVLLLIALDWLIEQGVRVGWYGAEWHRPLFTVAGVVVLSWLVWRNALALARLEAARDKAEREGHRLDEQMHVTLRSIGDAVIATDAAGRVTFLNEVAQTLTGWTAEQASGRPVTEVFHIINEATRATVESPVEKVLREGRIVGLANHTILVARDGRELPIDDSGAPIRDATGRITGVVLIFRDISERKETQQARAHHAAIVESSQDAMITVSLDGRFLTWNAGAEKMFGYTAEEVIGQPVMMFVQEDKQAEAWQILERRARGETIPPFETVRRRRDGSLVDVSLAVSPLKDLSGRLIGSSAVLRDISERKQAEEKLRASEERMRLASEAAEFGVYERRFDPDELEWSPPLKRIFGLPAEAPVRAGEPLQYVHPDDLERVSAKITAGFDPAGTGEFEDEHRIVRTDGAVRWIRARGRTEFQNGQPRRAYGTLIDITERRQAEQAIRESEERYRSLVSVITDVPWTTDAAGAFVETQPTWAAYTGQTWEEMRGFGWANALHPDDREGIQKLWEKAVAEKSLYESHGRVWHAASHAYSYFIARATPLLHADGSVREWVGTCTDIHERRLAEQALRESEERFSKAFRASPLVLTISSLETGELIEVNETFVNATGYTREEAIGRTTLDLGLWKKPGDRAEEMETVRQRGQVSNAEYTFRTKAGAELTGLLAAERIEIGGRPCALTVIQDITERKQAEEALRAAFEQAEAARAEAQFANQSKDEFLSVVTHELRSPLNAILGYTRLARTSADNAAEVIKNCNVIERSARAQQQLIDDLLDTARIMSGKLQLEVAPCDLRLVVEDALAVVRPAAEAKAITLGAQSDLSSVQLIADAARLQQVVWNLLQNAIKFTPAGGRVEVHLEADERRVCLSVSDNGKGIPPEFLPRIFDRFSQNDMSLSRRYGGLGLGLALVRQIVELHGGEVSATSDGEGCGATFTVSLPLRAPQPVISLPAFIQSGEVRTDEAALPTDNLPSLEGLCILAADDQAEARELIATALRESGARVMAVSSGLEVLALLADPPPGAKPDILLLDISMPDEDGYSVLKRVRALEAERGIPPPERLPAIALTAHTRAQDRLDALAAGFQMHVGKPLELAELIVVIASIMSGRRK